MKEISVLGVDLGKSTFHLYGVDARGHQVMSRKLTRARFREFMAKLPPCRVGLEACRGAHHWARVLSEHGHEVRLMHAKFVKAYVKTNKNDWRDAEAICEAVTRPNMRFVAVRTLEEQALQMLHRARASAVRARTAKANQLRGFLHEAGVVLGKGLSQVRRGVPEALAKHEGCWPRVLVEVLRGEHEELRRLDERIARYDEELKRWANEDGLCQLLMSIPGVGPVTATALVAKVGRGEEFRSARHMAAWLGLVPRHSGTGGQTRMYGISKRGDAYLRTNLIHGARAVIRQSKREDARVRWGQELVGRRGFNVACVAMANKMARTAWAMLRTGELYRARPVSG